MMYSYPEQAEPIQRRLKKQTKLFDFSTFMEVNKIFQDVEHRGDDAILELTAKFDDAILDSIRIPPDTLKAAVDMLGSSFRTTLSKVLDRIVHVNKIFLPPETMSHEIAPGVIVGESYHPIESVGFWVPSRRGPLISTALMLIAAAKAAGVGRIALGLPPSANGSPDELTVGAIYHAGVDEVYVGNGVGIIAGLTFGTETISPVSGIFGPGPGPIAAAMANSQIYGKKTMVGIGPTNSLMIIDDEVDPNIAAHDLLNEAEHGRDSATIAISLNKKTASMLQDNLKNIIAKDSLAPRRKILEHALSEEGLCTLITVDHVDHAIEFANDFAPEHLMLSCRPEMNTYIQDRIVHTGELLIGNNTPFSAANYAIGITAVLPTNGFAKILSGFTARDLIKSSTIGRLTQDALQDMLPIIDQLSKVEGLPTHLESARIRF